MKKIIVIWLLVLHWYLVFGAWNFVLASSSTSFGVYPPKISVVSPPDQKVKVPLKIINGGNLETLTFSVSSITTSTEGSVELNDKQEEATEWLKINNNELSRAVEKIDAVAESTLNLTIDIPKNALANDHYIALIVSALNNESYSTTNSRGVAQIAIPIIISVKETNTIEELKVEKFEIPGFSFNSEIPISLLVKNPGLYLIETVGTITSSGPLSKKHQEILPKETVLAGSSRLIGGKNFSLKTSGFGPTNISISIQLDKSDPLIITKSVFIVPVYLLLPVIMILVFLIFTILNSRNKKKTKPSPKQK